MATTTKPDVPAPAATIRKLATRGSRDLDIANIVLGLFDAILGFSSEDIFPTANWHLSAIEVLPHPLRNHARAVFEWGSHRGILLNEVVQARQQVRAAIVTLIRNSPYGRRRGRIATALRSKYPPRKPDGSQRIQQLEDVPVLSDAIGIPVSPATIRRLVAFSPSHIEINNSTDPYYSCADRSISIRLRKDGFTIDQITMAVVVAKAPKKAVIYGVLEDFFETGTEGLVWCVSDDDEMGYTALHPIKEGDHLTILDRLGYRVWCGRISCDRKAGWRQYPLNPKYGQPCALGQWVHWTQRGFEPDDWAQFFMRPDGDRLRAILRKPSVP